MKPCQRHTARSWPGPVTVDSRGRPRVFLGTSPRHVEGWRLVRYGRKAIRVCLNRWCVEPEHLEVSLAEYHGALHAFYTKLRDGRGRFATELSGHPAPAPRFGAIIGRAALEHMDR